MQRIHRRYLVSRHAGCILLCLSQGNQMASCHYEDDVFHSRVRTVLLQHHAEASSAPLFLYWAAHACHGPREVPAATYAKFSFISDHSRRMYRLRLCVE